jgi:hypothetical protein
LWNACCGNQMRGQHGEIVAGQTPCTIIDSQANAVSVGVAWPGFSDIGFVPRDADGQG